MSYQPRVRSAIWTTLVLLLVCTPATSSLAATKYADARLDSAQQSLAAAPTPTPPAGMTRGAGTPLPARWQRPARPPARPGARGGVRRVLRRIPGLPSVVRAARFLVRRTRS